MQNVPVVFEELLFTRPIFPGLVYILKKQADIRKTYGPLRDCHLECE